MPPPSSTDREALISALAEQARSDAPGEAEPEPEELLDYLAGRLDPEEARRIERLLVASPKATRALLDLAELEAAAAAAGWRALQPQLPAPPPRPRHPTWLSAIAASLLVATVGLGSWVWWLHSALHRPIANPVSLALLSGTRAGTEREVVVPPEKPLRLVLAPAERCTGYTAELEGPGRKRQTVEGLTRDEGGLVTFLLPRAEPGLYSLRLLGCEPRRTLEEQRFRITRPHDG